MLSKNFSVIIVIVSVCSTCDSTTSCNDTISKIFESPFRRLLMTFKLSSNIRNALEGFHLEKIVTNSSDVNYRNLCGIQKRSASSNIELPSTIEWFFDTIERKMRALFDTQSSKLSNEVNFQIEGRSRYRKLFPILVGAYMILSTVLIPIGVKFMMLLVTTSLLLSKLSTIMSLTGVFNKPALPSAYNFHPYYQYHSYHGPPPWRIDQNRKVSQILGNLHGSTTKEEETDFHESINDF